MGKDRPLHPIAVIHDEWKVRASGGRIRERLTPRQLQKPCDIRREFARFRFGLFEIFVSASDSVFNVGADDRIRGCFGVRDAQPSAFKRSAMEVACDLHPQLHHRRIDWKLSAARR